VLVAGVRQARPRDDRGLRAWVRGNVTTIFHPTSSCAMGASDAAVCDPALRVRGDTLLTSAELPAEPATVSSP
jgi:choline dehydrogenase